jgi:hypothetical protein
MTIRSYMRGQNQNVQILVIMIMIYVGAQFSGA